MIFISNKYERRVVREEREERGRREMEGGEERGEEKGTYKSSAVFLKLRNTIQLCTTAKISHMLCYVLFVYLW
jgi:hypothetical protein